jgi:O-antigen ligase
VIACFAAATALVSTDRRIRAAAMLVALAAAPVIELGSVWDEARVVDFRDSTATVAAALAGVALLVAAAAVAFRRFPELFPIASLVALPLRVPLEIGGETANLLVPLYVVIAGGALAYTFDGSTARTGREWIDPWARRLRWLLAAALVLYAVQTAYSDDVANAIENAGFFLVPFAVLAVLLTEVEWTRRLLGLALIAVATVAAACAAIALGQYVARDLFLNPELFDANQLHVYFRVNSIFFDPNILGRYLALAVTALGAYLAWDVERRGIALALVAAAICLAGLVVTYSITSFAALTAGLAMVAVLRWGWRGVAGAGGLILAGVVALLIAGGTPTSDIQTDRAIDSGRSSLIEGGMDLFEDRPLGGYGSGAFGRAFYDHIEKARSAISHSEPITVASEQGVIGLLFYLALLAAAAATLLGSAVGRSLPRTAVAACFAAMVVHSLGYAGFLTDPATWALLALGIALRRPPEPTPAST